MSLPEPLSIRANGLTQRVWRWPADAPPLVVVHGITNSARGWDFVCRRLHPSHAVYAVDLRGHGESDKPENGYATADYAADLAGIIEGLGLVRPTVLGHSLGGRAAARLAATRPDLVGRLVVVDPPVEGRTPAQVRETMDAFLTGARATRTGGAEAVRKLNPHWTDEQVEARVVGHRQVSDRVMLAPTEVHETESTLDDLGRVTAPTLFVYGDTDWRGPGNRPGIVRPEVAAEIGRILAHGPLAFVPRTGHMVPWDDLEGFLNAIRPFLAG